MFLRLYDGNRSTIQFHEKLLPAQRKSDKCFQTNKKLGWFLFFSTELPYKSLFTEERNKTFHIALTNINRILQADPDLAMHNMQETILTHNETPIIRNSDRSDIQLGFNKRKI